MSIENTVIKLLIESFTEECLEEVNKMKHPEDDLFNIGLTSADAAVRRVKNRWMDKLIKGINKENNQKII